MSIRFSIGFNDIREWSRGQWVNASEARAPDSPLTGLASLKRAVPGTVSFFFSLEFKGDLPGARPSVLIIGAPFVEGLRQSGLAIWKESAVLACDDPYLALAVLSEKFHRSAEAVTSISDGRGPWVHPTAVVDPTATIGVRCQIGPYCVIGAKTILAEGVHLDSHVTVGSHCSLGQGSRIFSMVTVYDHVTIGDRVRIHSGSVLGSDGFGYAPIKDAAGLVVDHQKIFHTGGLIIGSDVEVGANVCIDQGTLDPTVIGDKCKLDNDVHIAHNCRLGQGVIMCGMSGLAGGTVLDDFCYIGGQTGIGERARIGARALVGANSQVGKDVPPGGKVIGNPMRSFEDHYRAHATINRLMKQHRRRKEL